MKKALILALLLATATLASCEASRIPGVYRIDVQQGNVVTAEQLAQLEPGMEQRKVRFILGSPLLIDVFNDERWDYVYEFRPGAYFDEVRHKRVSLFFENQLLARVEGDVEPVKPEDLDKPREQVVSVPDLPRDDGFFSGLNPFADDRRPLPAPQPAGSGLSGEGGAQNPAEAAIEADAAADAEPEPSPAPVEEQAISDANEPASADEAEPAEDTEAESEGGFFRGLAESFGLGGSDNEESTAE